MNQNNLYEGDKINELAPDSRSWTVIFQNIVPCVIYSFGAKWWPFAQIIKTVVWEPKNIKLDGSTYVWCHILASNDLCLYREDCATLYSDTYHLGWALAML